MSTSHSNQYSSQHPQDIIHLQSTSLPNHTNDTMSLCSSSSSFNYRSDRCCKAPSIQTSFNDSNISSTTHGMTTTSDAPLSSPCQSSPLSSTSPHLSFSSYPTTPIDSFRPKMYSSEPESPPLTINGLTLSDIEQCIIDSTLKNGMDSKCCESLIPLGVVYSGSKRKQHGDTTTSSKALRSESPRLQLIPSPVSISNFPDLSNDTHNTINLAQSNCCSKQNSLQHRISQENVPVRPLHPCGETTVDCAKQSSCCPTTPTLIPSPNTNTTTSSSCTPIVKSPLDNICNQTVSFVNSSEPSGSGLGTGTIPASPSHPHHLNNSTVRCNTKSNLCPSSSQHLSSTSSPISSRSSITLEDNMYPAVSSNIHSASTTSSPYTINPVMFPSRSPSESPFNPPFVPSALPTSLPQSPALSASERDHLLLGSQTRCPWFGCNTETVMVNDILNHLVESHIPLHGNTPLYCQWGGSCWSQHANSEQLLWHIRVHHGVNSPPIPYSGSRPQTSQSQPSNVILMNTRQYQHYPVSSPISPPVVNLSPDNGSMFTQFPRTSTSTLTSSTVQNDSLQSQWSSTSNGGLEYTIKQESYDLTPSQELLLQQEQFHPCLWRDCKLYFSQFETLTNHLSEDHIGMGKSEYICEWTNCDRQGRGFSQRQKAMRHIQTHTGDKPFQCQVCHKRFSEANIMAQHMRTHTGEKPFKCTEPGCTRQFSISGALTIHRRVHTGEKPFKCKFEGCDKYFAESSNLTKHLRVHTGERPFQCPYLGCDKKFSRPDQVTRHKKTHLTDPERMAVLQAERIADYKRMG